MDLAINNPIIIVSRLNKVPIEKLLNKSPSCISGSRNISENILKTEYAIKKKAEIKPVLYINPFFKAK